MSGEGILHLKPLIKYPMYDYETETQNFPFKTVIMLIVLLVHISVSGLWHQTRFNSHLLSAQSWVQNVVCMEVLRMYAWQRTVKSIHLIIFNYYINYLFNIFNYICEKQWNLEESNKMWKKEELWRKIIGVQAIVIAMPSLWWYNTDSVHIAFSTILLLMFQLYLL